MKPGQYGRRTVSDVSADRDGAQPTSVPALLRKLNLQNASVERQKNAMKIWLRHNTPTAALKLSFRENGHGLLLERPRRSHDRRAG
jgi:hypothetical protein